MSFESPVYFNGEGGNVVINGVTISVTNSKYKISSDKLRTTSTNDGNFHTSITNQLEMEGTATINVDATSGFDPVSVFEPGMQTTGVLTLGDSFHTHSATVNILGWDFSNPATEVVTAELSFVSTGPITSTP